MKATLARAAPCGAKKIAVSRMIRCWVSKVTLSKVTFLTAGANDAIAASIFGMLGMLRPPLPDPRMRMVMAYAARARSRSVEPSPARFVCDNKKEQIAYRRAHHEARQHVRS